MVVIGTNEWYRSLGEPNGTTDGLSRRRFLAVVGGLLTGVAGCVSEASADELVDVLTAGEGVWYQEDFLPPESYQEEFPPPESLPDVSASQMNAYYTFRLYDGLRDGFHGNGQRQFEIVQPGGSRPLYGSLPTVQYIWRIDGTTLLLRVTPWPGVNPEAATEETIELSYDQGTNTFEIHHSERGSGVWTHFM